MVLQAYADLCLALFVMSVWVAAPSLENRASQLITFAMFMVLTLWRAIFTIPFGSCTEQLKKPDLVVNLPPSRGGMRESSTLLPAHSSGFFLCGQRLRDYL